MKKLITIIALAASVMATPAFAQSFNPSDGTGNVLSFSYGPGGAKQRWTEVSPQTNQIAGRQSGLDAYAMVSGASSATDSNSPAVTGGGSEGYNQLVETY
jgi:hypothetical protein